MARWTPTGIAGVISSPSGPIVEFIDRGIECVAWAPPGSRPMTQEGLEASARRAGFGEVDPLGRYVASRLERLLGPWDAATGPPCTCRHAWTEHEQPTAWRRRDRDGEVTWRGARCARCPCWSFALSLTRGTKRN